MYKRPMSELLCNVSSVEDAVRFGGLLEIGKNTIKELIDANRQRATAEIAEGLNLWNSTIHGHCKENPPL